MKHSSSIEPTTIRFVRLGLLTIFLVGTAGTAAELYLLEHTEKTLQWVPLTLLALGLVSLAAFLTLRNRLTLRMLQIVLTLFVVAGITGVILHYRGNVEFELEMYPTRAGFELFWESIRGATPALAPGTMIQLGLVGLVYSFRHPLRDSAAQLSA